MPPVEQQKILHVDDDEAVLRMVAHYLESNGYSVHSTATPFIAPIIQQEKPDVIVMDVDMPLLSGDRIVAVLHSHEFTGIPIIFFSGKSPQELAALTSKHPGSTYVRKESGLPVLLQKIRSATISSKE